MTAPFILFYDNNYAIVFASDSVLHERMNYIEVNVHFIIEKVRSRMITPSFVTYVDQTANMFTKPVDHSLLKSSLIKLDLIDIFAPALGGQYNSLLYIMAFNLSQWITRNRFLSLFQTIN